MRANVFRAIDQFGLEPRDKPFPGAGDAIVRMTLTSICHTDV
ncbi:MAG: NAD(P)-dependent alcohol dehydrogenase, partial [Deltaproteobacteria bacterium]|nr:NAD(P)-dependent alcohol dehydrogenase [Deltaproteobacteria bacterium]